MYKYNCHNALLAYCIMLISVSFIDVIYNIIKTKRLTEKYNFAGALRCLPRFLYHHIRRIGSGEFVENLTKRGRARSP